LNQGLEGVWPQGGFAPAFPGSRSLGVFSRDKNPGRELWRSGEFARGKYETAAEKAPVLGLVFQVEPLHVVFEVFERSMGADQFLPGIPVIHDEEFPSQVEAAQIMNMGTVRGKMDDPRTIVGIDPV
jgi:hypothetical protein